MSELGDGQRRELKLAGGVRIEAVDGPAARAGLRPGDLILALNNTRLQGLQQFQSLLAKVTPGQTLQMLVRRGDAVTYVLLKPTKP